MAKIWIDGEAHEVEQDKNLLEVILSLGFDLPYFCWHPALGSVGSCRQCAVRKYRNQEDNQGTIVMSCMEPVSPDLHISIKEQGVSDFRKHVIEWLMVNHPHDCPICDEGGECHLQDMTVMAGHAYRRSRFKKRTHLNQDLGPCINHEMNRCIQCYRCVRFYNDYAGGDDLQVFSAHDHVYFGRHEDGTLESEFSGNLVEVCPTGVFTDKTLKNHYTRKWDLTSAPSVCQHCSLGCNILAGERYGSLRRILSRFNSEVNGYFICDRGRFGYDFVNGPSRILQSGVREKQDWRPILKDEAIQQMAKQGGEGKVMGIGSPRASLESNYALRTLVGPQNFYNGLSEKENRQIQNALQFLKGHGIKTPSLKEIESCDAVIIIGEDVTQTAPMIDLALKQSVLVQPLKKINAAGIPSWNDAAVRGHIQEEKGPLYILTPQTTKLDSIASRCFRGSPEQLAHTISKLSSQLDMAPGDSDNGPSETGLEEIARALIRAENPLVITGTSLGSEALMQSGMMLASALHAKNTHTQITFVFPECNSLGVAMMENKCLGQALASVKGHSTLVVLENDLFRRQPAKITEKLLGNFKNIVALDHTRSQTTDSSTLLLSAGTFAEADGTMVNNEGRAQRYFQVQAADQEVMESWRWIYLAGQLQGNDAMKDWQILDDVISSLEEALPQFKGISQAAPGANYRVHGQKLTREPHRYSGRTAMFAQHNVNEARPPQDQDTPLSYTMEGYRGITPASATSFYWSPGWNSAQAINKFRNEITSHKQRNDLGIRLIEPSGGESSADFANLPGEVETKGKWKIVPLHHIFGSEEMSMRSQAIAERSPEPGFTINDGKALQLNLKQGQQITVIADEVEITLPVHLDPAWPEGLLGVSAGYPGVPFVVSGARADLKKSPKA